MTGIRGSGASNCSCSLGESADARWEELEEFCENEGLPLRAGRSIYPTEPAPIQMATGIIRNALPPLLARAERGKQI